MHIKRIAIQGFKSYKDQTVTEPFSKKTNIVVGKNGAGKSNFFAAIRFVLSDAYTNMSREERQALLHEGSSSATTMSAYVEIVFDNSDFRFPTQKAEFILRRTIGLKKDEYSIDRKTVSKSEINAMMEAAGFAKSNPYYIVPQGRVSVLCNSKEEERLQLLKEVAGTRVYEQKREESEKIMKETDNKRQKIEELLKYINERLSELEEEKEELRQYYDLEKKKKHYEYTIHNRELNALKTEMEEIEEEVQDVKPLSGKAGKMRAEAAGKLESIEREIDELETAKKRLEAEDGQLNDDEEELFKKKKRLELSKNETAEEQGELQKLEKQFEQEENDEKKLNDMLQKLQNDKEYLSLKDKKAVLEKEVKSAAKRRDIVYKLKSENITNASRFKAYMDQEITKTSELKAEIEASKKEASGKSLELLKSLKRSETAVEITENKMNESKKALREMKQNENALLLKRKDCWNRESELRGRMAAAKNEYQNLLSKLEVDKSIIKAIQFIKSMVSSKRVRGKIYGCVYELIDFQKEYEVVVERIVNKNLFNIVVDTDDTVVELIDLMKQNRIFSRLTFIPVKRLSVPNEMDVDVSKSQAGASQERVMVKDLIKVSNPEIENKDALLKHLFNKYCLVSDLGKHRSFLLQNDLNGVNLDGDLLDRKGGMTGGYVDYKKRLFSVLSKMNKISLPKIEQELAEVLHELESVESELNVVRNAQLVKNKEFEEIKMKLIKFKQEEDQVPVEMSSSVDDLFENVEIEIQELSKLLAAGFKSIEQHVDMAPINSKLVDINNKLLTFEKKILKLNNEIQLLHEKHVLTSGLLKKLSTKLEKPEGLVMSDSDVSAELSAVQKRRQEIAAEVSIIGENLKQLSEKHDELLQLAQQEELTLLEEEKKLDKYLSKKNSLLQKIQEASQKIRDLGNIPPTSEDDEDLEKLTSSKIIKMLHGVNKNLKKFAHVNKKAYEQYNQFTKQRDDLNARKNELDESSKAIEDLINVLDQRKDEAIERTFGQVEKNFAEIFQKLVPAGQGKLIIRRNLPAKSGDIYTGVGIQVSFNSRTDEGLLMQQLSGGQKSLVALALIFAIQKCDPAPFYLFDEIDANLDPAYRFTVANMINELSENAQFICTTFRPELIDFGDKFYGVSFKDRISSIDTISKDDAMQFVEQQ